MTDHGHRPRGSASTVSAGQHGPAPASDAPDRCARQVSGAVSETPESGDSDATSGEGGDAPDRADERTRRPWSLTVAAVALAIGAGYLVLAFGLPAGDLARPRFGFFPRIAATVLIGAALATGAEAFRAWRRGRRDVVARPGPRAQRVFLLLGLLVLYVLLVGLLGHVPTASVVAALTIRIAGDRAWWQSAVLGVVLGVASMILFDWIMGMRLPG